MNAIETCGLTKSYGKHRGIEALDLTVEAGDFFGFIGPNGAGKSTTIRTLLGLISPTGGSAKVLGMDITRDRQRILQKVGYLPSETAYYSGMRVKDVIRYSADLHKTDCRPEAARLCERLGLDPSRKVEELSLGNRKKVGITCALQHMPELIIMDEPTSGLDPLIQREFYDLLTERNRAGATIFFSSHVLSEVRRLCRHAAVIRAGKLLASGTVEELGRADAKRVTVRGIASLPALSGVKDVKTSPDGISFLYGGAASELLRALAPMDIADIMITEPDPEDVFMHYYEEGGARE